MLPGGKDGQEQHLSLGGAGTEMRPCRGQLVLKESGKVGTMGCGVPG